MIPVALSRFGFSRRASSRRNMASMIASHVESHQSSTSNGINTAVRSSRPRNSRIIQPMSTTHTAGCHIVSNEPSFGKNAEKCSLNRSWLSVIRFRKGKRYRAANAQQFHWKQCHCCPRLCRMQLGRRRGNPCQPTWLLNEIRGEETSSSPPLAF